MELTKGDYITIRDHIHVLCGLELSDDKEYLIKQRLEPVLKMKGCESFSEFAKIIQFHPDNLLRDQIIAAITTSETSFFRDHYPFELFKSHLLPQFMKIAHQRKQRMAERKGAKISILSAGASTGQEPYSLSIVIYEFLKVNTAQNLLPDDFLVVAADVSSRSLSLAVAGEYEDAEIKNGLDPGLRERYFVCQDHRWLVQDSVRRIIEFRRINFVEPFMHLGGFDLILCRNVLPMYDLATRQKILNQFHYMLSENGVLVLGATENVYTMSHQFESRKYEESGYYVKKM